MQRLRQTQAGDLEQEFYAGANSVKDYHRKLIANV